MSDIGYENIFIECEKISERSEVSFEKFRELKQFSFLVNNDEHPDEEAITIGKKFDEQMYLKYVNGRKTKLGYGEEIKYSNFDGLDSRHYMLNVFLFNELNKINVNEFNNILEIGGGFGNWLYINEFLIKFNKWYIIDLNFVIKLQEWFLKKEFVNKCKYELISCDEYNNVLQNHQIDLCIATHSLSELSKEKFDEYINFIQNNVKYFFYSYHTFLPNKHLINYKKDQIDLYFDKINFFYCENNNVINILYKNKNIEKKYI